MASLATYLVETRVESRVRSKWAEGEVMLIQNVSEGSSPEDLGKKLAALLKNPSLEAGYGVARTCDGLERAIVASRKGEGEAMNLCNLLGALEEHDKSIKGVFWDYLLQEMASLPGRAGKAVHDAASGFVDNAFPRWPLVVGGVVIVGGALFVASSRK